MKYDWASNVLLKNITKIACLNDTLFKALGHIVLIRFVNFYLKFVKITYSSIFIVLC